MAANDRSISVTTPLGPDKLRVTGFSCEEGISRLFDLRIDVIADAATPVEFDTLLGQGVTLTLVLPDGTTRHLHGIAAGVTKGATDGVAATMRRTAYRLEVVPKLWLLTRSRQSRIFQQKSVPDILREVLQGLNVSYEIQGTFEPRDYCAQYRETDFEFASRLMEEEGIFYFFKHADGQHTMVLANTPVSHPDMPGGSTLKFEPVAGGVRPEDRVIEWEKTQQLAPGKFTLWDHSFELPDKTLEATTPLKPATAVVGTATHKLRVAANERLEVYDYPGEYAQRFDGVAPGGSDRAADVQKIFQDNTRTVDIRMAEAAARSITVHAASDCRQLVTGHKFTLAGNGDADGAYVVVSARHEGRAGSSDRSGEAEAFEYANAFTCLPTAIPYRPGRTTPRPRVAGCQTAVVVGPAGEEIFTDKYGRVKVQFRWDRAGQKNQNSSCWVRVASFWAGRRWGAVHLPRVGQEVVVDFEEGDPDQPIVVGSVYNADNMPPYALPANKTQSGVKSRSTPQGSDETFNELRFEDKKGSEQVFFQAQKDLDAVVKHDETHVVWHDRTTTILNHDTRNVGGKDKDGNEIGGNDTLVVTKGNRDVTVTEGNLTTTVGKNTTTTVGEHDEVSIGKNQTLDVGEARTTTVGKDEALTIGGKRTSDVAKDDVLTVGKKLTIEAGDEIVLKTGMSTITMKKDGTIEIKGKDLKVQAMVGLEMKAATVKINAQGQAEIKSAMVKVQGDGMLQLKAPMTQVNGDGMLMAKGGLTMIN